jgi:hypothetical protein
MRHGPGLSDGFIFLLCLTPERSQGKRQCQYKISGIHADVNSGIYK